MADEKVAIKTEPAGEVSPEQARVARAQERILGHGQVTMPAHVSSTTQKTAPSYSAYQHTLFASAGSEGKPAWSDSTAGRGLIRLFSRGIVGTLCFTMGTRYAREQMVDYDEYAFKLADAKEKPLQLLAKTFDVVLGKPIANMHRGVAHLRGLNPAEVESAAWNAVHFRTKGYFHSIGGKLDPHLDARNGRSLGAEMVSVTFDFAMASIGDASTRNFIQMIDPNIRKSWRVNDKGEVAKDGEKSHVDWKKLVSSTGKAAWRVFSKNQMEDWWAAPFYVYQMKLQRNTMSHFLKDHLKGAKIVFDNGWNGGAYKLNDAGKIVGDYQLVGAADLHARFVGYNIYTLMFREGYDNISNTLQKWKDNHYSMHFHLPEHFNPVTSTLHAIKDGARYVVKSTIKANLYMNPAVIPFWMMRVPQTKWRGALINPEAGEGINAIASTISAQERIDETMQRHNAAYPNDQVSFGEMERRMTYLQGRPVHNYSSWEHRTVPSSPTPEHMYMGDVRFESPTAKLGGNVYSPEIYKDYRKSSSTTFSKALNPFGKFSYWLGGKATDLGNKLPNGKIREYLSDSKTPGASTAPFMRYFVDNSLSYTPYMFAKAETALRVDKRKGDGTPGEMDTTIYNFMDNVWHFNFSGMKSSVKKMIYLSTHKEKAIVSREGPTVDTAEPEPTVPQTTVQPGGRKHDPILLSQKEEQNKNASTDLNERRWAETIAGRNLAAQFQSTTTQTRH